MAFDINTLNGIQIAGVRFFLSQGTVTIGPDNQFTIEDGTPARDILTTYQISDVDTTTRAGAINADGEYVPPAFGYVIINEARYPVIGFGNDGNSIVLGYSDYSIQSIGSEYGGSVTIINLTIPPDVDDLENDPDPVSFPLSINYDPDTFTSPVCFAEGTLIATPSGEIAVETLVEGDLVLTASGAARAVAWVGRMIAHPTLHPRPWEVNPVRVRAGAFGPGLPVRDLLLSPGHAVLVDGVLAPVGHLVNGATIVQDAVEQVRYFHLELASHDVLVAEGLPCESYLDDGNRATFANAEGIAELHGRLDPRSWDDACAPLVAGGPQLVQIQQALHARAEALGWAKREDADLKLVVDGTEIAPLHEAGDRYWFAAPVGSTLALRSNSGVLAHLIPGFEDGRELGVAVADLRIDGVAVDLEDAAFGAGFLPVEQHEDNRWRWTNGEGRIERALTSAAMVEVALLMVAPSWRRAAPQLRVVQAA